MPEPESVVIDSSALVDLLLGGRPSTAVANRVRGSELHAPANLDAEVLSALGRIQRAGGLTEAQVRDRLKRLAAARIRRHELMGLLEGAWRRRHNLRVVDALYVELADQIDSVVVTTDRAMASASDQVELLGGA